LGKGTFGRVFKVSQEVEGRQIFKALKLVLPGDGFGNNLDLLKEKQSLGKAAEVLADSVARADDFHAFGTMGAAMILNDIGTAVPRDAWGQVFSSLGALHERNILHGDPRLANAIYVEGAVRWIDFRNSVVAVNNGLLSLKRNDLEILVKSCRHEMGTTREIDLDQYNGTGASAEAVFSQFQALNRVPDVT